MKFDRKVSKWGGSTGISLPQDLLLYLNLKQGDDIVIEDKMGQYGPYLVIYEKGASNDTNTKTIE